MLRVSRVALAVAISAGISGALLAGCFPDFQFDGTVAEPSDVADRRESGEDVAETGGDADAAPDGDGGESGVIASGGWLAFKKAGYGAAICANDAGQLVCWGDDYANSYGELGDLAADASIPRPSRVTTRAPVFHYDLGSQHACFVYPADGGGTSVTCRGRNEGYQRGNPEPSGPLETDVQGLPARGLSQVAATVWGTCGIAVQDGTAGNVYCWGTNSDGQAGRPLDDPRDRNRAWAVVHAPDAGVFGIHDAVTIAGGAFHVCVITAQKKILCWGATEFFQAGADQGGGDAGCDNAAKCNSVPQEVVISGQDPIQLALGERHSCALVRGGRVFCWGSNGADQLGLGGTPAPRSCPARGGETWGTGCASTPIEVSGLTGVRSISAGLMHTCALHDTGRVSCWGNNFYGSLGTGDTVQHAAPTPVRDVNTTQPMIFESMAVGGFKSCGVSGGSLYCWGPGVLGTSLGDGGDPDNRFPAVVRW